MGNFIASKLFVGLASFAGGVVATMGARKAYAIATQPKPLVFDHTAISKLKPEDQAVVRGLAGQAGIQA